MTEDVVEILDFEWDIFSDVLIRIGGTLTVDKAIKIVSDEDEDSVDYESFIKDIEGLN